MSIHMAGENSMNGCRLVVLAAVLTGCFAGCDWSPFHRGGDSQGYWLPLTVAVKFDPSVTGATLAYTDACRQPKVISAGDRLTYALRREIGLAFERVQLDGADSKHAADGELEMSLGLKEIELMIPRQADKRHAVTVHLGGTVVFRDLAGAVLYTKGVRIDFQGEVDTTRQSCEVSGLAEVVNDAEWILARGIKQQLGTSVKLQEYAGRREAERR
jgi:hypothetical protein